MAQSNPTVPQPKMWRAITQKVLDLLAPNVTIVASPPFFKDEKWSILYGDDCRYRIYEYQMSAWFGANFERLRTPSSSTVATHPAISICSTARKLPKLLISDRIARPLVAGKTASANRYTNLRRLKPTRATPVKVEDHSAVMFAAVIHLRCCSMSCLRNSSNSATVLVVGWKPSLPCHASRSWSRQ